MLKVFQSHFEEDAMEKESVLNQTFGLLVAIILQRAAEILRDPTKADAKERKALAEIIEKVSREGVAQESLKLATKP